MLEHLAFGGMKFPFWQSTITVVPIRFDRGTQNLKSWQINRLTSRKYRRHFTSINDGHIMSATACS